MNKETVVARNPKLLDSRLDGEVVMLNIETGKYLNLNETGSSIWELIESGPQSLGALADTLSGQYDVDRRTCLDDLVRFVEAVKDENVLIIE
jgi:hypothetical protein